MLTNKKFKDFFNKFQVIQEMNGDTKQMVVRFLDLAIRDFKARQAYGN
ncbi:hypothetical protein [Marinifilum breve]|nr:hypothetical protein [Marinifilum breve]